MAHSHITLISSDKKVASDVIITGDPIRAQRIAEMHLKDFYRYNNVRNEWGFTGWHNGKEISVQAVGMGIPSLSIYLNELKGLGAQRIIRAGTAGSCQEYIKVGNIIIAESSSSDSAIHDNVFYNGIAAMRPTRSLMEKAVQKAGGRMITWHLGKIFATDDFYSPHNPDQWKKWQARGFHGIDMETAELYYMAGLLGFEALSILTVSDNIVTGEHLSPHEREECSSAMMKIILEVLTE